MDKAKTIIRIISSLLAMLIIVGYCYQLYLELSLDLVVEGLKSYPCTDEIRRSLSGRVILFFIAVFFFLGWIWYIGKKGLIKAFACLVSAIFCYSLSIQVIGKNCEKLIVSYNAYPLFENSKSYSFDSAIVSYNNKETVKKSELEKGYENYDYTEVLLFRKYLIGKEKYKWVFNGIGSFFQLPNHITHDPEKHLLTDL